MPGIPGCPYGPAGCPLGKPVGIPPGPDEFGADVIGCPDCPGGAWPGCKPEGGCPGCGCPPGPAIGGGVLIGGFELGLALSSAWPFDPFLDFFPRVDCSTIFRISSSSIGLCSNLHSN